MTDTDEINIPEAALAVKPWFPDRPSEDIIREIKKFIAEGNQPHLWRGHTHTKPPENALPVYRAEVDIPGGKKSRARWAPCPCCTPRHRKWFASGKIAWFPEEGVIRIIGPKCFASLNAQGHSDALDALRQEQRRERDIEYLLRNMGVVPDAIEALTAALALAGALDGFRDQLHKRLNVFMRNPLWNHLREGTLSIRTIRPETRRSPDGREYTVEVHDQVGYARIAGHGMLDPRLRSFKARVGSELSRLESINQGHDPAAAIATMTDGERHKAAKQLGLAIRSAHAVLDQMEDVRRFLSAETLATLRRWGAHKDSPVRMYAKRQNDSFYIGESQTEQMRIQLDPSIDKVLPKLPMIAAVEV